MNNPINIFDYSDYRTFLKLYSEHKRQQVGHWSYGLWAQKLELGGTAVLTNIINGKRHPGKKITEKLLQYFQFNEQESEYFSDLIALQKLESAPKLRFLLLDKLRQQHPSSKFAQIDDHTFSLISKWHYLAIWESMATSHFTEDADELAKQLRFEVSAKEVKKALADLELLGLLKRDQNQKAQKSDHMIKTGSDFANEARRRFHEQMLKNGQSSLEQVSHDLRDITGRFMAINTKQLPEIKKIIAEFRDRLAGMFQTPSAGDETYYLGVQFFPVTQFQTKHHKEQQYEH